MGDKQNVVRLMSLSDTIHTSELIMNIYCGRYIPNQASSYILQFFFKTRLSPKKELRKICTPTTAPALCFVHGKYELARLLQVMAAAGQAIGI
jgi:hypothetical protein